VFPGWLLIYFFSFIVQFEKIGIDDRRRHPFNIASMGGRPLAAATALMFFKRVFKPDRCRMLPRSSQACAACH